MDTISPCHLKNPRFFYPFISTCCRFFAFFFYFIKSRSILRTRTNSEDRSLTTTTSHYKHLLHVVVHAHRQTDIHTEREMVLLCKWPGISHWNSAVYIRGVKSVLSSHNILSLCACLHGKIWLRNVPIWISNTLMSSS